MDQILINHLRQLYLEDPSGFHPTALWKLFHMYDQGTYEIHMEAGSIHKLEVTCNKQLVVYYDTHREAFQRDPMAYDLVLLNQVYTDGSRKFGHVRPYFKLTHTLTTIEAPRPISGYYSRAVKVEEELKMVRDFINACYTDIQVTEEMVEAWTQEPVYHGSLWQWVIDESNHKPVGLGIGTYDPNIGEGALEWIQVLPEMRGKGLGQVVVKTLLMTLKTMADFVTVSGALDSLYKPYKLYEACGFSQMATWLIISHPILDKKS